MNNSHKNSIAEFEHMGESELRYKMAHGSFFGNRALAEEWLRQKEDERMLASSSRRDARESEMLKMARKASSDALLAKIAAIIAAIAAIIGAINNIISTYLKNTS